MKRNCYNCPRKGECYTESGLATLAPDHVGDCGALYTNFEEARAFIFAVAEAIKNQGEAVENAIIKDVANRYGCDRYNVLSELD